MKEIIMPEVYYSEEFDINIEPFVKADDVISIAETALTMDNPMEQEICIAVNVIRECTDANVDDYIDNLDVNKILYSGLWDEVKRHIKNIHDIYIYIEKKESADIALAHFLNVTATEFLNNINDKLGEYLDAQDIDALIKDAPKTLSEILDIVKQDGNADIIRGAFKMSETSESEGKVADAE